MISMAAKRRAAPRRPYRQTAAGKGALELPPPRYDGLRLVRTQQLRLAAVARRLPPDEVSLLHQPVHVDGHQICLETAQLHHVSGRFIGGVVAQKHQDIKGCF